MIKDQHKEIMDTLKNKDFALAAFLYEMDNHEYAINYDGDGDVLGCFGLEADDLEKMGVRNGISISTQETLRSYARVRRVLMVKKGE